MSNVIGERREIRYEGQHRNDECSRFTGTYVPEEVNGIVEGLKKKSFN
jgi:hypothetical protein